MKHNKNIFNFTEPENAIYTGEVFHARHRPFYHSYRYRVVVTFIDIDALPELNKEHKFFSLNSWNIMSLYNEDHGLRTQKPMRKWVERAGDTKGLDFSNKKIFLLCFPRLWGYVFNPISIYFIYAPDNTAEYILYEVKNTFGEQHGYLLPLEPSTHPEKPYSHKAEKMLHVSPFISMNSQYHFKIRPPEEDFSVAIHQFEETQKILTVLWEGEKRAFSDRNILKTALTAPFSTLKVTAAIHWQALRLWQKGARYIRKPEQKKQDIS